MKTHITITALLISLLLITACSNESKKYAPESTEYSPEAMTINETGKFQENEPDETSVKIERKIIKTADVEIEVQDIKSARLALNKLIKKYDAYISDEKVSEWDNRLNDEITIRVAAENFDSLLNHVSNLAVHVVSKHVSLSDVTEEYIDIKTRLENKKKVEQQYLELLKKAKNINEILQINEHLRKIREEIEAKEGRLKYLNNQVSLSTIYLSMYQQIEQGSYPGFGNKMLKAFKGGWEGIQVFVLALIYLWPFIIIVSVVVWLIVRRRRKKKNLQS